MTLANNVEKEYICDMELVARQLIREKVLEFLRKQPSPVALGSIADDLRHQNDLSEVRDSDVRNVVQSMIVTGRLDYAPGLKIELRKAAANAL
jgi:hypothetical protein